MPGDRHSDCDWLVATHAPLTEGEVSGLCDLHAGTPDRVGHWWGELEGSYAPLAELASVAGLGRPWLLNDHGYGTLTWDDHCNRGFTRWIVREHGITLTGSDARSFMSAVPADVARRGACVPAHVPRRPRHVDRPRRGRQGAAVRRGQDLPRCTGVE